MCIILFLGYLWITGKMATEILGITKKSSSLFYGFVFFFAVFWLISMPFQILGLNWDGYFQAISALMIGYPVAIVTTYLLQIRNKKINLQSPTTIEWKNLLISVVFFATACLFYVKFFYNIVSIFDSGLMGTGIVRDDFFYTGLATNLIGSESMFQDFTGVDYFGQTITSVSFDRKISISESFMAYASALFQIKPVEFSHYYMPMLFYVMVFFTIKEAVFQVTKKRSWVYLIGIIVFLLVSPSGDTLKFLVTPWYGNLVNIFIMPSALLVMYTLMTDKQFNLVKKLLFFIAFSIFVNSFAAISAFGYLAILVILLPSGLFTFNYKHKWPVSIITSLGLLAMMHVIANLGTGYELESTKRFIVDARMYILAFAFFVIIYLKTEHKIEKKYYGYFYSVMIIVLLTYLPVVNNYLFETYSFIYKRFMDMVIFQVVIWGSVCISNYVFYEKLLKTETKKWLKIVGAMIATILLFYVAYDKGIEKLYEKTLDETTINYKYKIHPLVVEVAEDVLGNEQGQVLVNNYTTNQTRIPFLEFIPLINSELTTESLYIFERVRPYDNYIALSESEYQQKLRANDFYLTVDKSEVEQLTSQADVTIIGLIPQQHELTSDLYILDLRGLK